MHINLVGLQIYSHKFITLFLSVNGLIVVSLQLFSRKFLSLFSQVYIIFLVSLWLDSYEVMWMILLMHDFVFCSLSFSCQFMTFFFFFASFRDLSSIVLPNRKFGKFSQKSDWDHWKGNIFEQTSLSVSSRSFSNQTCKINTLMVKTY